MLTFNIIIFHLDYVCIGKTPSGTTFPLYDNPTGNYCTGYISCSAGGVATSLSCPDINDEQQDKTHWAC